MTPRTHHTALVVLLAAASLGTTVLIALNVVARRRDDAPLKLRPLSRSAVEPPILGAVRPFRFTDARDAPFESDRLTNRVWIANFIFTRCSGPCRRMSLAMQRLQARLREHPNSDDIRFVSVTVDPEFDSPDVLRHYAEAYEADASRWHFLTGSKATIHRVIREQFTLPVQDTGDPAHAILHSRNFVLVDRNGRIRGYYQGIESRRPDGTAEPPEIDDLLRDIDRVLAETGTRAVQDPPAAQAPATTD